MKLPVLGRGAYFYQFKTGLVDDQRSSALRRNKKRKVGEGEQRKKKSTSDHHTATKRKNGVAVGPHTHIHPPPPFYTQPATGARAKEKHGLANKEPNGLPYGPWAGARADQGSPKRLLF